MPVLLRDPLLDRLEQVAATARELGIETALIGALAVAAHGYVRATQDSDLGSHVSPGQDLTRLRDALEALGFKAELRMPDDEDPLGGVVRIWQEEDADENPLDPIDVVNFKNPYRPGDRNPGEAAIRDAVQVEGSSLRCVRLADLIALKLYTRGRRDREDVIELLQRNPDADLAEIEQTCLRYRLDQTFREILAVARPQ